MGLKIADGNYIQETSIQVKIMVIMPKLWAGMISSSVSPVQSGMY